MLKTIPQIALNLLLFIFLTTATFSQTASETPIALELEKPVERNLSGTAKHIYSFSLAENQYAKIIIEQKGINVVVNLTGGDRTIVDSLRFDTAILSNEAETIEAVSRQPANFMLEVRAVTPRLKGDYVITLKEIKPAAERDFALDEARRFLFKATTLGQAGKIDEGIEVALKSLAIREKEIGAKSFETSKALFTLGRLFSEKKDYGKSINYYEQALKISEELFGKESLKLSSILQNLSTNYEEQKNLRKAEELALRHLEIGKKNLEPNHPDIADALNNLAIIKKAKGEREAAENLYLQAIKIRETVFGGESAEVAASLMNLATLYDDIKKSEPLFLRALAIEEKLYGANHPRIAQTLYNLALAYLDIADYAKAEPVARRSLEILEKTLGPEHPLTAYPLKTVGLISLNQGKYDEAEVFYKRAAANTEKINGEYNPAFASALSLLGDLYAVKGEIEKAVEYKSRAGELKYRLFLLNMANGSEKEKLDYFREQTNERDKSLTFIFNYASQSKPATEAGALFLLRQKGRILDSLADSLNVVRQSLAEKDRFLLENYNEKNKQIAKLLLAGQSRAKPEEYQANVKKLNAERDAIEKEISLKGAELFNLKGNFSLAQIQNAIPENGVLLEFSAYTPIALNTNGLPAGKPRYGVFVLHKNGTVKAKDLGEKDAVDTSIKKLREALQNPKSQNIRILAREASAKIFAPLRELLGNSTQLLISPDGELNLIPFETLLETEGKYLVEKYAISYLSSGRDLLRMQNARTNENPPLIIANPAFGETDRTSNGAERRKPKRDKQSTVTVAESIADTYFTLLSGTEEEGKEIKTLFPEATLLSGDKAIETAVKQVKSPKILHFATHGFFIEGATETTATENPLLRSGLALAGANNRQNREDDGILTALESAGLNLYGTKLVVLSACGTGLGEVKTGEGVFGLRRSFVSAGAESLVISLWSVSDLATRELMQDYYKNLKLGFGRGESLRKVQLEMLKNPKRQHPFYWASFIQSGDWKALENNK